MIVNNYSTFREVFATASTHDVAGYRTWPSANVGAAGFNSGMPMVKPVKSFPIHATCNGLATDTVFGVDEYDWYLSQRTDDATKQYLSIVQIEGDATSTYSGTVTISLTSLAVSALGLADSTSTVSIDNLIRVFKHVDLYVRRRSDALIQHMLLLEKTLSNY